MNMKLRMIQNDGNSEVQGYIEDDDADEVEDDIEEMIVRMKMMKERIIRGWRCEVDIEDDDNEREVEGDGDGEKVEK